MTTASQWVQGARLRTLPAAVAPVLVGTGAAASAGDAVLWKALLALVVSLSLQVGVNYANDYSDGVRGTDADRVGPLRLVGSGTARPGAVRAAAFAAFALAGGCGVVLAATTSWWLLLGGAAAIAAAWFYTGGSRPYGYRGLGEVAVFVFFGLVAVLGTSYVQVERLTAVAWAGGIGVGAIACALLVANNLRDIPSDRAAGKRTLAVKIGEAKSRRLYVRLLVVAFVAVFALAAATPWALLALGAVPLAGRSSRLVLRGADGPGLVRVLQQTGVMELEYAVLLTIGLLLGSL